VDRTATAVAGDDEATDADDAPSVARGDVIGGKYRVDDVLGRGGMGIVLGATHLTLDERVAIKMLRPSFVRNAEVLARFMREARATVKLKGQHVARVLDVDALPDGAPYIVMEYLEGCDLDRKLQRDGALPIDEAVRVLVQACAGVAEAHAQRIVHRDLKPANLFVANDGCVKVLDFGVSRILDDSGVSRGMETSVNRIVGTTRYMAPEQHESAKKADERSDVWALGVIAYQVLTGKHAYEGESSAVIYAKILSSAPPRPRNVPDALGDIVVKCMQRDPAARFQTATALSDALQAFDRERERDEQRPTEPAPAPARSKIPIFVAAAAVLAMGIGYLAVRAARAPTAAALVPPPAIAAETATATATETATATATATASASTSVDPPGRAAAKAVVARPPPRAAPSASAPATVDDSYKHRTSF
jgi:serine/threonine-protein kinase